MSKLKILVTGGAGYKGVILCKGLLDLNHDVTIIDNFMYGYQGILHLLEYKKLRIIEKDIRNIELSDVSDFDLIFHLAGISGMPACKLNIHSAIEINDKATEKIISLLSPSQKIIYASTTSVYGSKNDLCTEQLVLDSFPSTYAETKYNAEKYVLSHNNSIVFRFATIFGISPRMRDDLLVNDFTRRAVQERTINLFDSKSKRTFLHIRDAINAYLMCIDEFSNTEGLYNVGSSNLNLSKQEIANEIRMQLDFEIVESQLKDLDVRNFTIDFSKINKLGYVSNVSLSEGVIELLNLYKFYNLYRPYKVI